jgi:two-component system, OmpR family, sensor histidine kinase BaeS
LISLRWKLGGSLLLVVLISVGIMAYLTNLNTATQFEQYVHGNNMMYSQNLASELEQYYSEQRSWAGVQEILNTYLRSTSEQLIIADDKDNIIADTSGTLIGKSAREFNSDTSTVLKNGGLKVGTLYFLPTGNGIGRGNKGGMGMGNANRSTTIPAVTMETEFINRINNYLWIAGIIAVLIALIIGVLITRQFTRPIEALTTGAQKISEGDLAYRVKVRSGDEIGKLAESFNSMAGCLEQSEQSRKRLVSDVTHELRTPLTIIEGTVDGILDGVFPPDREHLDTIKEQTASLTHLVSDLRDLSLAESGQLKLQKLPTNLTELINRKLSQFEAGAKQKNIRLKLEARGEIPDIAVDSRRIEQVITNLLSNALRHTPKEGTITISVSANETDSLSRITSISISVADTGEGIPAEHLPHIFERFYRVDTSRVKGEGESGVGLGLAIVKNMVEAHGGQVKVESQPGKGSVFYLTLPIEQKS